MGRKFVLTDDFDGSDLPDDTQPTVLSIGRKSWNLYLSDDNLGKLYEALGPFTNNAETATPRATPAPAKQSVSKDRTKAVREWAQATKATFTNAQGEQATLGDRGRIPQEIYDAYDQAHN